MVRRMTAILSLWLSALTPCAWAAPHSVSSTLREAQPAERPAQTAGLESSMLAAGAEEGGTTWPVTVHDVSYVIEGGAGLRGAGAIVFEIAQLLENEASIVGSCPGFNAPRALWVIRGTSSYAPEKGENGAFIAATDGQRTARLDTGTLDTDFDASWQHYLRLAGSSPAFPGTPVVPAARIRITADKPRVSQGSRLRIQRLAAGLEETLRKVVENVPQHIVGLTYDATTQRLFLAGASNSTDPAQLAVYAVGQAARKTPLFTIALTSDADTQIDAMAVSPARRTLYFLRWRETTGTEVLALPFPDSSGWAADTTPKVLHARPSRGWSSLAVQGDTLYVLTGTQECTLLNAVTGRVLESAAPVKWPPGTPSWLHLTGLIAHGSTLVAAAVTAGAEFDSLWVLEGPAASTTWRRLGFAPIPGEGFNHLAMDPIAPSPLLYLSTHHRIAVVSPTDGRLLRQKVVVGDQHGVERFPLAHSRPRKIAPMSCSWPSQSPRATVALWR